MPIEAIIWDIGGVMARTVDRQPRTTLASRFGLTYESLETLVFGGDQGRMAQLGEITYQQHLRWVCSQLGIPPKDGSQFMDDFFGGDILDRKLVTFIRRLHKKYKTGIISNGFDNVRSHLHAKWAIADAFDHIVISGEVGLMKPDPHIFSLALNGLGAEPAQSVFIDDVAKNIEGARAFGLQAVQFITPEQTIAEITQLISNHH